MSTVSNEVAEAYADCWAYDPNSPHAAGTWKDVAQRRNLDFFATRWLPRDEAKWVMEQWVKEYNYFTPKLIDRFPADAEIRIAREGSVCLYVRVSPGWELQRLPTAKRMEADEREEVFLQSARCVRYWWD